MSAIHGYMPRWIRAISWPNKFKDFAQQSNNVLMFVVFPSAMAWFFGNNPSSNMIALKKPKNEEELMAIKRTYRNSVWQRNWDIDQYEYQVPPYYDLAERRAQYPQYYGTRYSGYKKTGV